MTRRRRMGAAALSAALLWGGTAPARAQSCDLGDLLNALGNSIGSIGDLAACGGVGPEAGLALVAVLGGVAAADGQGSVNNFCTSVQNANNAVDNIGTLLSYLPGDLSSQLQQQLQDAIGNLDPLGVAQCACQAEQSFDQAGNDLGSCLESFLCWGDALLGNPCMCTPSPPTQVNCSAALANCSLDPKLSQGQGQLPGVGSGCSGPNDCTDPCFGYLDGNVLLMGSYSQVTSSSQGTLVVYNPGGCGGALYCFCPSNMVLSCVPDEGRGDCVEACECPPGSHSVSDWTQPISSCQCDNGTGPPIAPASDGPLKGVYCLPPLTGSPCPPGKQKFGDLCITPCPAGEGLTLDGVCCNPSQITSCGTCCAPGLVPDPATGTCVPESIAQ